MKGKRRRERDPGDPSLNLRTVFGESDSAFAIHVEPARARPGGVIEVAAPEGETWGTPWELCTQVPGGWRRDYLLLGGANGFVDLDEQQEGFSNDVGYSGAHPTSLRLPAELPVGVYQVRTRGGAVAGAAVIEVVD